MFIPFGKIFSNFFKGSPFSFGFNILNATASFNNYRSDKEKLAIVLSNPAVLKVFALQCDLFSLGKVCVKDKDGNEIEDDPFLTLIKKPNPFNSQSQFLWDYMFFTMMGTSYCYVDSKVVDKKGNKMYNLEPFKIEWPLSLERKKDKLIFSDSAVEELMKTEITYRFDDGSDYRFPYDRLISSFDLTNGIGNFFKGASRLDALYKIISNSEAALDSKNINVRYSGKYLVASQNETGATTKPGMTESEKEDIRDKMDSSEKNVYPLRSMVQIRRFVEDLGSMQLDPAYLADYFLIGNMYNIPRDVLEAFVSSTYENQEKARAAHVNYTLEPKGNEWMDKFEMHFDYPASGKNIVMSWNHLPFMQIFDKEKSENKKIKIDSLSSLIGLGIPMDQANAFLETDFVIPPVEKTVEDNSDPATLEAQAGLRGSVGGVQGILAIQSSVAMGTTTYESAISMLTIIYGFTAEQAAELLGEPETSLS